MTRLSTRHIENCSREISRWAKAVRLIHSLEYNLQGVFPEPDLIEPAHKPYDLQIIWEADNPEYSAKLRKRIATALQLEMKWQLDRGGYYCLYGRVRLGKRTTVYLRLLVAGGQEISGHIENPESGRLFNR